MKAFICVIKNNFRRLAEHKPKFLLYAFLATGALAAAIFVNTNADTAWNIAVVSASDAQIAAAHANMTRLEAEPAMSELVAGKYDAVVVFDGQGDYEIKTIKSDETKDMLNAAISEQTAFGAGQIGSRGSGSNIVGFMMMFILMQGGSLMFMFAEDKERKQIRRIAASPVSFTGYLCAHCFFAFIVLLAPVMALLFVAKVILGIGIGFSLLNYLFLASLLCVLSTSFALFLIAVIKKSDSANMVCSASTVLTTILAGSFYSFDKGNKALETVIKVLPQKALLSMSELMEQGKSISSWINFCLYIAAFVALFLVVGVAKTRKDYVRS